MSVLTTDPPRTRSSTAPAVAPDAQPRRDTRPPLRLVEPIAPARQGVRVGVIGTLLVGVCITGIFALAAMHSLVVQAQFDLDRIDQQVADRRGELDALRLDVARLESPGAIAAAAAQLGLVNPTERLYLEPVAIAPTVADETVSTTAAPDGTDLAAAAGSGGR